MTALNLTRVTMGLIILGGILFFKPLAYAGAVMMILSGLTGL